MCQALKIFIPLYAYFINIMGGCEGFVKEDKYFPAALPQVFFKLEYILL
jgi:hypothetical protein